MPEYGEEAVVRSVTSKGSTRFRGFQFHLFRALAGQAVAFVPKDDGIWEILFYNHRRGEIDERMETLSNGKTARAIRKSRPRSKRVFLPFLGTPEV